MLRSYTQLVDMVTGIDNRLSCRCSVSQTVDNASYTEGTTVPYLYKWKRIMSMSSAFSYDPLFFSCIWILCSWDHASQFYVNKCLTRCNYTQFILSVNCSTCFGWFLHPSSGAQASGTSRPSTVVATCSYRGVETLNSPTVATGSNNGWLVPNAVDTVTCATDDGWRDHPKYVEQFTDKINCVELHLFEYLLTLSYIYYISSVITRSSEILLCALV